MNIFKRIIKWINDAPAAIKNLISNKILPATTSLIVVLNSDLAIMAVNIIPGEKDNTIRMALIVALQALEDTLKRAQASKDIKLMKKAAGKVGKHMLATLHGDKLSEAEYDKYFEKVFQETKAA